MVGYGSTDSSFHFIDPFGLMVKLDSLIDTVSHKFPSYLRITCPQYVYTYITIRTCVFINSRVFR